jgi:hypothetical protein
MAVNKVAFTVVGLACVAAAGAGGYLALRQNAPDATQAAASVPSATPAETTAPARPVEETEDVVAPVKAPAVEKAPKKVATPVPVTKTPVKAATSPQPVAPKPAARPPIAQAPAPDPIAPAPAKTDTTDRVAQDVPPAPAPPQHTFEELVVSADSVIGLQSDTTVTSEHARVEDRVEGRVTRDVKVGDHVAIPAGSRAIGYVTQVDQGGKFKQQAKLAIRFQTIVLGDGTRLPISTAAVEREGDAKGNSTAAKVGGGAVAGTILGAILGGGKGAAIGGLAGAGAGTAATAAGDRSVATLRAGEPITVRLLSPVTVTTETK